MHKQAEKFGTRFSYAEATDFDASNRHIRIKADDEWLETEALIIASGASARYLGLENEQKLIGHGLTSCATCDGAFYKNVPVCVVGGGDSAAEESLFLTRFASKVYLITKKLVESRHRGVFVAGDVADRVYKQAVTAAGSGCAAAMDAEKYLSEYETPS